MVRTVLIANEATNTLLYEHVPRISQFARDGGRQTTYL